MFLWLLVPGIGLLYGGIKADSWAHRLYDEGNLDGDLGLMIAQFWSLIGIVVAVIGACLILAAGVLALR